MKAVSINDLDPRYQEQVRKQLGDRPTGKTTHVERGACHESVGQKAAARCDGQVSISVLSKRGRLADADGLCFKYVLDALVDCGVLRSDDAKTIPQEPRITQEKSDKEETIITITW